MLALLRPTPLCAQETELRGEVSESAILSDQQRKARQLSAGRISRPAGAGRRSRAGQSADRRDLSAGQCRRRAGRHRRRRPTRPAAFSIRRRPPTTRPPTIRRPPKPRRPSTAKQTRRRCRQGQGQGRRSRRRRRPRPRTPPRHGPPRPTTAATTDTDQDTANRRALTIDSADRQKLDPGAERTDAIEGQNKKAEDDPFAATGIKVGSFVHPADARARPDGDVERRFEQRRQVGAAVGNGAALFRRLRLAREFGDDRRLRHLPQHRIGLRGSRRAGPHRRHSSTSISTMNCAPSPSSATRPCRNRPPRRTPLPASTRSRCARPSTAASASRRTSARCASR